MPSFDASPLLNNPDFKVPGGFTIRKYTITEDENGIGVKTFVDVHAEGVIVPSVSLGMERTAETERQGSGITVYTQTPISTGDASIGQPADDIIWNNLLWQVVSEDDYSIWGFNVAMAEMQDPGARSVA